jgi:hypothetical protein
MADKESLVIGSKVKAYIKGKGLMCSGDLADAVSDLVKEALDKAATRTTANKRSTVRPHDL